MISSGEARRLCLEADHRGAAATLERKGLDIRSLRDFLRGGSYADEEILGHAKTVELTDGLGRRTEMDVYIPSERIAAPLGVILALHGVGSSGPHLEPQFRALADACGAALICPTAPLSAESQNNFDLAGIFGSRFNEKRWFYGSQDIPMQALRWACINLPVDSDHCAVIGVSMGGIATWNLALRRWGWFSMAASINGAPSMWEMFGPDGQLQALLPNLLALPMAVLHGSRDQQIPPRLDRDAVNRLRGMGHKNVTFDEIAQGEHRLESMALEPGSTQFAALVNSYRGSLRDPWPRTVEHRATDSDSGRALWVSIDDIATGHTARVRATVVNSHHIDIVTENTSKMTLHLSDRLIRPGLTALTVNSVTQEIMFTPRMEDAIASYALSGGDVGLMGQMIVELDVPTSTFIEVIHA